jgi:methyl-accepting chemotaxis protein
MQSFHAMKTGTKLAGGFGLLVALLLAVTAVTIWRIQSINTEVAEILDDRAVKVAIATDIDQAINVQARALRNMIIGHKDAEEVRASLDRIQKTSADITALLAKLQPMLNTEAGRQAYKTIVDTRVAYAKGRDEVVALIQAGKVDEAGVSLLKTQRPAQTAYLEAVEGFSVSQAKLMTQAGETAEADGLAAVRTTVGLSLLATLLAAAVAYAITRSITRQLGGEPAEAAEIAATIAQGDLSRPVPVEAGDTTSMQASLVRVVSEVRRTPRAWPRPARRSRRATRICPAAPSSRPARCSRPRRRWSNSAPRCATTPTTPARPTSWRRAPRRWRREAATWSAGGHHDAGHQRQQPQDRRHHQRDRRHRLPDQHPGAERGGRSGARRRTGPWLRGGGQRGAQPGAAQRRGGQGDQDPDRPQRRAGRAGHGAGRPGRQDHGRDRRSIRRVSDIVAEISAASAEQSSGVQQVGDAVGQMDQATQQNAALVEESAAAAESLKTAGAAAGAGGGGVQAGRPTALAGAVWPV